MSAVFKQEPIALADMDEAFIRDLEERAALVIHDARDDFHYTEGNLPEMSARDAFLGFGCILEGEPIPNAEHIQALVYTAAQTAAVWRSRGGKGGLVFAFARFGNRLEWRADVITHPREYYAYAQRLVRWRRPELQEVHA